MLVMLNRGDYWQCAYVIPKGGVERGQGARASTPFRDASSRCRRSCATARRDQSWDDVKLLTVAVDRLRAAGTEPGLLCIGDAAHAMSPIGGVGINLAIQDAVAAANILAEPLRRGARHASTTLDAVQQRPRLPTRVTQRIQILMQNNLIGAGAARQRHAAAGAAG